MEMNMNDDSKKSTRTTAMTQNMRQNLREGLRVCAFKAGIENATLEQVGTIDHVQEKFLQLRKTDSWDMQHHWIPMEWVDRFENDAVILNKNVDEVRSQALSESDMQRTA